MGEVEEEVVDAEGETGFVVVCWAGWGRLLGVSLGHGFGRGWQTCLQQRRLSTILRVHAMFLCFLIFICIDLARSGHDPVMVISFGGLLDKKQKIL